MAFPTVTESGGESGSASSHTLTLPSHATGDLLILATCADYASSVQTWTFNGSTSAFSELDVRRDGPGVSAYCKYRVMQGGDDSTIVIGTTNTVPLTYQWFIIPAATFSGVPEAAAIDLAYGSSKDPPSLSPSWGSADTLWIATNCNYLTITAYPTNYTSLGQRGSNVMVGSAYRQYASSSDDPSAFTWNYSYYGNAVTIAIQPAGAAAVGFSQGFIM